jgi:ribosomal protein L35
MPKLKTKKGVVKRFKLTKRRKITYHPGGKSHLATNKEPERLRKLRHSMRANNKKREKYIIAMLPYGTP